MNKYFLLIIAAVLVVLPHIGFAHILSTDGRIGAVMHIDPDDNPIAGQPTKVLF